MPSLVEVNSLDSIPFKLCKSEFHVGDAKLPKTREFFYTKLDKHKKRVWSTYCKACEGRERRAAKQRKLAVAKETLLEIAHGRKHPEVILNGIRDYAYACAECFMTPEESFKEYRMVYERAKERGNLPLMEKMIRFGVELAEKVAKVEDMEKDEMRKGVAAMVEAMPEAYRKKLMKEFGIIEARMRDGSVLALAHANGNGHNGNGHAEVDDE